MGLFDFGKKPKKEEVSEKKESKEEFEIGSNGLIFNAKIQIIAAPKDYAKKVADNYVEAISKNVDKKQKKMYYVLKKKISPITKLKKEDKSKEEKSSDLYKVFIEMDVGVKNKTKLFDFCFEYMPFSIEVLEPMNLNFSANELTDYATSIQATIHKIDENLKQVNAANQILNQRNQNLTHNMIRMLRNNIILSLKEKNKDIKELVKNIGIEEEQLKPFIDNMLKDNEIKLEKKKYSVVK